jgi:hypothetical protein
MISRTTQRSPPMRDLDLDELRKVAELARRNLHVNPCSCSRQTCICGEREMHTAMFREVFTPETYLALLDRVAELEIRCIHHGEPATCFGVYEDSTNPVEIGCDDCCGHGNEDGWCEPYHPEAVIMELTSARASASQLDEENVKLAEQAQAWKAAAEALEIAYWGEPSVGELPLIDAARKLERGESK